MASKDIMATVLRYYDAIEKHIDVQRVMLFGSSAKGTNHEYSDIDIAIFTDNEPDNYLSTLQKLYRIGRSVDSRIEPHLLFTHEPVPLTAIVEEEGIEVVR